MKVIREAKKGPRAGDLPLGQCFRYRHPIDYANIYMKIEGNQHIHLNKGRIYVDNHREIVPVDGVFTYTDED